MAAPVVAFVVAAHRAPAYAPIRVQAGEMPTPGVVDTQWPQFTWMVGADGAGGWMPTSLLQHDASEPPRAVAREDYGTTELETDPGDRILLHRLLADGWWAENEKGMRGWIPARALAPPAAAGTTD